jgi:threonine/homoserine/homoserine lactone efflux protein
MDTEMLTRFLIAIFLLALAPGPDLLYVLALSISKGVKTAIITALGLVSGLVVHTFLIVFGLAALLVRFPEIKSVLIYLGAGYLFYLSISGFLRKNQSSEQLLEVKERTQRYYWRGVTMNLLNPKVSLFFLAFFPGFLFHQTWSVQLQFGIMGMLFMLVSLFVFSTVAIVGARMGNYLKANNSRLPLMRYFTPTVLFLIAIYLLLSSNL